VEKGYSAPKRQKVYGPRIWMLRPGFSGELIRGWGAGAPSIGGFLGFWDGGGCGGSARYRGWCQRQGVKYFQLPLTIKPKIKYTVY